MLHRATIIAVIVSAVACSGERAYLPLNIQLSHRAIANDPQSVMLITTIVNRSKKPIEIDEPRLGPTLMLFVRARDSDEFLPLHGPIDYVDPLGSVVLEPGEKVTVESNLANLPSGRSTYKVHYSGLIRQGGKEERIECDSRAIDVDH